MNARGRGGFVVLAIVASLVVMAVVGLLLVRRGASGSRQGSLSAQVGRHRVTITGTVPTEAVKREIGARGAELVGGAQNVTNELAVDGGVSDGQWLNAAIGGFAGLPPEPRPLTYEVEGDTLTLTGKAASAAEKTALLETVTELSQSAFTIDDQVTVAGK